MTCIIETEKKSKMARLSEEPKKKSRGKKVKTPPQEDGCLGGCVGSNAKSKKKSQRGCTSILDSLFNSAEEPPVRKLPDVGALRSPFLGPESTDDEEAPLKKEDELSEPEFEQENLPELKNSLEGVQGYDIKFPLSPTQKTMTAQAVLDEMTDMKMAKSKQLKSEFRFFSTTAIAGALLTFILVIVCFHDEIATGVQVVQSRLQDHAMQMKAFYTGEEIAPVSSLEEGNLQGDQRGPLSKQEVIKRIIDETRQKLKDIPHKHGPERAAELTRLSKDITQRVKAFREPGRSKKSRKSSTLQTSKSNKHAAEQEARAAAGTKNQV